MIKYWFLCVYTASDVHSSCYNVLSPVFYDHGYLSTPNYPDKYYLDADCHWRLSVQAKQIIRFTLFDFELDIRRAGKCKDFLEISSGRRSVIINPPPLSCETTPPRLCVIFPVFNLRGCKICASSKFAPPIIFLHFQISRNNPDAGARTF